MSARQAKHGIIPFKISQTDKLLKLRNIGIKLIT